MTRTPLFALIPLAISLLLFGYIYFRFIRKTVWGKSHPRLSLTITLVLFAIQLAGPMLLRSSSVDLDSVSGQLLQALRAASYFTIGIIGCLFFYTLLGDIVCGGWWLTRHLIQRFGAQGKPGQINYQRRQALAVGTVTLGSLGTGYAQAITGPVVKEVEIPLKNLPAKFDGFKIVQISDLHVGGNIGRAYTENVVKLANELKPDLIALTGDFVDGSVEKLQYDVAPLADLTATHGTFFITGNHEYFSGADEWITEFKRLGARVLLNEHELISINDEQIVLAGVTDYSTLRSGEGPGGGSKGQPCSPQQALQGAPAGLTRILLAHQPITCDLAHAAGVDLQLSGHTHAGQFFPFSMFIGLFQKYYKGLNRHENMWVYVNVGTGYWGPPLRTANASEITLIRLKTV